MSRNLGRLRVCLREKIPEQNFALHDSELVALVLTEVFPFEEVTEDDAGLLGVSLSEGLVEGLHEFFV